MKRIYMLFIAVLFSLLSCNDKYPDLEDGLYAEIVTDKGTMVAELYYQDAPATVANFVALAEGVHPMADSAYAGKPFYNGLKFHRIIKDFMIQGGDPNGNGSGNPGYKFHDEFSPTRKHDKAGVLSMANSGYETNGSQFFITHTATPHLDGYDQDGNIKDCPNPRVSCHTVWGQVVVGLEVIDAITAVEMVDPRAGKPKDDVFIQQVTIIRKGSEAKKFDAPAVFKEELAKFEEKRAAEAAERAKQFAAIKAEFDSTKAKAETLESGLQIFWNKRGEGPKPKVGEQIKVDYAGYFSSGELFDTSIRSIAESQNKVNPRAPYQPMVREYSPDMALISGFKEGLLSMKVGDKITLFIPSHLGYGSQGFRGVIPPNEDLIFELELLDVIKK